MSSKSTMMANWNKNKWQWYLILTISGIIYLFNYGSVNFAEMISMWLFGISVVAVLYGTFFLRGYKCPKCGTRTSEVEEKDWVDKTPEKGDGTKDKRYNTIGHFLLTIKCSNETCGHTFQTIENNSSEDGINVGSYMDKGESILNEMKKNDPKLEKALNHTGIAKRRVRIKGVLQFGSYNAYEEAVLGTRSLPPCPTDIKDFVKSIPDKELSDGSEGKLFMKSGLAKKFISKYKAMKESGELEEYLNNYRLDKEKNKKKNESEIVENSNQKEIKSKTPKKNISIADEIKKFKELLDAGAITQEEYDAEKKKLFGL
jgi:hypothetical protein|tara:strand:- start:75 stop:1019 length:945 start_codon:yes stop_codon:yes gene_type:complete